MHFKCERCKNKYILYYIMKFYTLYVSFIFFIKILYFIFSVLVKYFTYKKNNKLIEIFTSWKHHMEFIFIILMSILLIVLFNPLKNGLHLIDKETKILLFLYGIIILINAQWDLFFKDSNIFTILNKLI